MIECQYFTKKNVKLPILLFYDYEEESTKFELLDDVLVKFDGQDFIIEKGFVSDGMSVPRGLWNWASPLDARWICCFLKHDARIYFQAMLKTTDRC